MRRKLFMVGVLVITVIAMAAINQFEPSRLTAKRLAEAKEAQERMEKIEASAAAEPEAASKTAPAEPTEQKATPAAGPSAEKGVNPVAEEVSQESPDASAMPDVFKVKLECSNGTFVVETHKDWAPRGAARFYELVQQGIFNEAHFFRVVPNFVVQFGIPGDPAVAAKWRTSRIMDDPVKTPNETGTLVFATSGPNSRTTQLFINLGDNRRLDAMGFSPIGKVIEGMEVVKTITSEYGERPDQGAIQQRGNAYLKEQFPRLDYIKKATVVK